ncbi:MAG: DUF1846 domain-containing protein [Oscillospiraceae bacterium]
MTEKIGFNNDLYVKEQSLKIKERLEMFGGKLYLEFGGKLFDDWHASRVLPGFDVNAKINLLMALREEAELIICISAPSIESSKMRDDMGITYDMDALRLIDDLRKRGIYIGSVVITQYTGQPAADIFKNKLTKRGVRVYVHGLTKGYPSDVQKIVSDEGYGANPYIETTKPLVVVTAPGPGSGKLATCLSQLFHENKNGKKAGYAKCETFPVWDLPLQHPVNLAYEAATADLKDVNMIDPFHLAAYNVTAVNYNRDIEVFPVVRAILKRITGEDIYKSPTDMGVNAIGKCITDDDVVKEAACQEVIRRYFKAQCAFKKGEIDDETFNKNELLMHTLGLTPDERSVVEPALKKSKKSGASAVAIELSNGEIVTGKASQLMNSTSSCILNSVKVLAGISDDMLLISPIVLEPIIRLKKEVLGSRYPVLTAEEVLIALSISAATNPTAAMAVEELRQLRGCEAHSSDIISSPDSTTFRKLGINITCEPQYPTKSLYFR